MTQLNAFDLDFDLQPLIENYMISNFITGWIKNYKNMYKIILKSIGIMFIYIKKSTFLTL